MVYSKKKNAICGIYKITNTLNNKCYIGESSSIIDRWWIQGHGALTNCLSGKRPTCKGFKWKYKN